MFSMFYRLDYKYPIELQSELFTSRLLVHLNKYEIIIKHILGLLSF